MASPSVSANVSEVVPEIPSESLRICDQVGCGAFGQVYKAKHTDWHQIVAVKCICSNVMLDDKSKTALYGEAGKLGRLRSSHIVTVHGVCLKPNFYALVMDFLENGSLRTLFEKFASTNIKTDFPWPLRWRIIFETSLGMNYLHKMYPVLLHLDLKSQNVLLDDYFHVKICDFGLSVWKRQSSEAVGLEKKVGGTITHIPPEAMADINSLRTPTTKFDIYGFGVFIWEVLTGETPYQGAANAVHIQVCVKEGQRPDLKIIAIPPERAEEGNAIVALMKKCWHQIPEERPEFSESVKQLEVLCKKEVLDDAKVAAINIGKQMEEERNVTRMTSQFEGMTLDDAVQFHTKIMEQEGSNLRQQDVEMVPVSEDLPLPKEECLAPELTRGQGNKSGWPMSGPVAGPLAGPVAGPNGRGATVGPSAGVTASAAIAGGDHYVTGLSPKVQMPAMAGRQNVVNMTNCRNIHIGNQKVVNLPPGMSSNATKEYAKMGVNPTPRWSTVNVNIFPKNPERLLQTEDFLTLSRSIGKNWKSLGRRLGLSDSDLDTIQYDNQREGLQEICYQMLKEWKQRQGQDAIMKNFVSACNQEQRFDLIQLINT